MNCSHTVLYSDGCRNHTSSGYLICDKESNIIIDRQGLQNLSSNEVEYCGVLNALELVMANGIVYTDSQLVEGQVMFNWKIKKEHLRKYVTACKRLVAKKNIRLKWIRRDENKAGIILEQRQPFKPRTRFYLDKEYTELQF